MVLSAKRKNSRGFTLIEAMVVTAIIAIIAGVAWSLYTQQSIKNRRTEAITALTRIANAFEDCHSDTLTYVGCDAIPAVTTVINQLTVYAASFVPAPTARTFTITLTPIGSQTADADCTTLTLNQVGVKGYTGTAPSAARCWDTTN